MQFWYIIALSKCLMVSKMQITSSQCTVFYSLDSSIISSRRIRRTAVTPTRRILIIRRILMFTWTVIWSPRGQRERERQRQSAVISCWISQQPQCPPISRRGKIYIQTDGRTYRRSGSQAVATLLSAYSSVAILAARNQSLSAMMEAIVK